MWLRMLLRGTRADYVLAASSCAKLARQSDAGIRYVLSVSLWYVAVKKVLPCGVVSPV